MCCSTCLSSCSKTLHPTEQLKPAQCVHGVFVLFTLCRDTKQALVLLPQSLLHKPELRTRCGSAAAGAAGSGELKDGNEMKNVHVSGALFLAALLWIYFCPLTSLTNTCITADPPCEDPHGCYRCNVALLCVNLKLQDSG